MYHFLKLGVSHLPLGSKWLSDILKKVRNIGKRSRARGSHEEMIRALRSKEKRVAQLEAELAATRENVDDQRQKIENLENNPAEPFYLLE